MYMKIMVKQRFRIVRGICDEFWLRKRIPRLEICQEHADRENQKCNTLKEIHVLAVQGHLWFFSFMKPIVRFL